MLKSSPGNRCADEKRIGATNKLTGQITVLRNEYAANCMSRLGHDSTARYPYSDQSGYCPYKALRSFHPSLKAKERLS